MIRYNTNKKLQARYLSIVEPYQRHFGDRLPLSKQYWTLCGSQVINGAILPETELDQLLNAGLIRTAQFHGVDRSPTVIEQNRTLASAHWYVGDFRHVIMSAIVAKDFNPGVVNCDFVGTPSVEAPYFAGIVSMLTRYDNVMVVGNMATKIRQFMTSRKAFMEILWSQPAFQFALENGWKVDIDPTTSKPYVVEYSGRKDLDDRVKMTSIVLVRRT